MDEFHGQWADCSVCGQPFPIFGAVIEACVPCRKTERGERLTKSELTMRVLHKFYQDKMQDLVTDFSKRMAKKTAELKENQSIVRRSSEKDGTIDSLKIRLEVAQIEAARLREILYQKDSYIRQLNNVIATLNQDLMRRPTSSASSDFDLSEMNFLAKVSHPDRHGGNEEMKKVATQLIKKIIDIRKRLKG